MQMRPQITQISQMPQMRSGVERALRKAQEPNTKEVFNLRDLRDRRTKFPYLGFSTAQGTNISSKEIPPCWNVWR